MKERIKYLEYKLSKVNDFFERFSQSSELSKKMKERNEILEELLFYKTLQGGHGEPSDEQNGEGFTLQYISSELGYGGSGRC